MKKKKRARRERCHRFFSEEGQIFFNRANNDWEYRTTFTRCSARQKREISIKGEKIGYCMDCFYDFLGFLPESTRSKFSYD